MKQHHLVVYSDHPFDLGTDHQPYQVLRTPDHFSCAHCEYLRPQEDTTHHCANEHFRAFTGTSLLVDNEGMPLTDPRLACSDWFEARK